ncbi:MAG: hypothetical protein WCJ52_12995, partial [Phenylobacterium sp.]|uniref:hypothetical protein n=1 Tax=Phenylobacterium sp. TaxID=1871053 RepID=UPI00301935C8
RMTTQAPRRTPSRRLSIEPQVAPEAGIAVEARRNRSHAHAQPEGSAQGEKKRSRCRINDGLTMA